MAIEKSLYTARATTTGGRRNGKSSSSDGQLLVTLNAPKALGGSGEGTNPEQLFAAGYSACFLGAMQLMAKQHQITLSPQTKITAEVDFGPLADGAKGYGIAVSMQIEVPELDKDKVEAIVAAAHQVCPDSQATRGNIDVTLTVV